MKRGYLIFFIGTIAEYIKLFTVIEEAKSRNLPYKIIASGQNEIADTDIAKHTNLHIDLQLSKESDIVKNAPGLFSWYFKNLYSSKRVILNAFKDVDFEKSIMVVHGDTLSTVMGAKLSKKLGMRLAHVEAGLRSGNYFSPFPEELDRIAVSRISNYNFCQSDSAKQNLKNVNGLIIPTVYNTIIDSINYSKGVATNNELVSQSTSYCVFVVHRQENLLNSAFVKKIVDKAISVSKNKKVIFILHKITEQTLINLKLYDKLDVASNIELVRRMDYFDFMKLLINSDFVITDGGSNQEELSYMGKPTLVMRNHTERSEGIGENAVLYGGDLNKIDEFVENYELYKRTEIVADESPSKIICQELDKELNHI